MSPTDIRIVSSLRRVLDDEAERLGQPAGYSSAVGSCGLVIRRHDGAEVGVRGE
jgi:hypothetical protein